MLLNLILSAVLTFSSPVNYEISLAGNFGEPRPNHFHGGIDVKTGGVEGKAILSIGDGYVSRIVVGLYGYGNAVYIHHPEGYTSMYCHLKRFNPQISAAVKRCQYQLQEANIDVRLKPGDCPISRGEVIAISGNTGSSQAPHLHLELYQTRTGNRLDPLNVLGGYVKDDMKPIGHAFMAYPVGGEGTFCGSPSKQSFHLTTEPRRYTAWGKVGFGIWANDYMGSTYNKYGIRDTKLVVDGKVVFHSDVNDIPDDCNRLVNYWGDYHFFLRYGVWYMKSFVEPGNFLPILDANENGGIVDFNEERDYDVVYAISDFAGNTKEYKFIVKGKKTSFGTRKKTSSLLLRMEWNKPNTFHLHDADLYIKPQSLTDNVVLKPTIVKQGNKISDKYSFCDKSYPLVKWAKLRLKCHTTVNDPSKLYIASSYGAVRYHSFYKDGYVTGYIRDLGAYYDVAYDDIAPAITPIGQRRWNVSNVVRIGVSDSGSGLKSWRGYIDGEFVLFENVPKSLWLSCDLKKTPIKRTGKSRSLKIVVTDNVNNTNTYTTQIKY